LGKHCALTVRNSDTGTGSVSSFFLSKGSVRGTLKRDRNEDKEAKKARKAALKAERAVRLTTAQSLPPKHKKLTYIFLFFFFW
jgi:hypothetical protein